MALECDYCSDNEAKLVLTNLDSGDVTRICGACFPNFILNMAEAIAEASGASEDPTDADNNSEAPGEATDGTTDDSGAASSQGLAEDHADTPADADVSAAADIAADSTDSNQAVDEHASVKS